MVVNLSAYFSGITSQITSTPPSAVPGFIINTYTKYLWNYGPESWVARIASSYRVLAFIIALPVIILSLLDIVSYGIARTLGVVDDVKASTSDKVTGAATGSVPVIHINGEDALESEICTDSDREHMADHIRARRAASSLLTPSQPKVFYASDSDGLKLAGADIFSPAVSEPSSPTTSRGDPFEAEYVPDDNEDGVEEGLRHRLVRVEGVDN
ncbi:hypothetical protein P691DRAFT_803426 [Macrolepiota fuliginosa MF-IS2]|uniref:Uncharacterized protein n=1 Tax=Macrolepiota fuliginosa MF-IS2 TaxID=1400762 RepID=A0A9P6C5P6_9AGAR|nr:hypothetical protein P691DRAFT_803426 [Macrolepiota fuliginosa MF-IS2]